jgi:CheY-like chemotaxis protein
VEAHDGDVALDVAIREHPDLIIADINMPRVDGWEFCWNLRKRPEVREIPFIFLTDRYGVSDRVRGLGVGAEDYITKPFEAEDLLARIDAVFAKRKEEGPEPVVEAVEASLMGRVHQFPLPDVLQNINRQGQSGVLEVRKGTETGRIYIREGEAINASLGQHQGKKAFYRIIGWDEGVFEFREEEADVDVIFQESTIRLILDGVKQLDEIRRLEGEMFPEDAELILTGLESGAAASHFPPQVSSLFELIKEHSALQDVVDASPLDDYKIYSALALLIGSGIVEARSRTRKEGER